MLLTVALTEGGNLSDPSESCNPESDDSTHCTKWKHLLVKPLVVCGLLFQGGG